MSAYQLNLHRHVRIWFNENPDEFMPFINQLRLVQFRETNPEDVMTLIYAKNLLSQAAREKLIKFANRFNIILLSLEELGEIIKANADKDEYALYELAIKEISLAKTKTGFFAAAKDILQWISVVYQLGIYSDFDTTINTAGLPEAISVDAPVILPVGSVRLKRSFTSSEFYESVVTNNDIFAIANVTSSNPAEASQNQLAIIKRAHSYILRCYRDSKECINLYRELLEKVKGLDVETNEFNKKILANNVRTLSNFVGMGHDPFSIRQTILNKYHSVQTLLQRARMSKDTLLQSWYASHMSKKDTPIMRGTFDPDVDKAIENIREFLLQASLKNAVVNFSGAVALFYALDAGGSLKAKDLEMNYKKFSWLHYDLAHAFKSGVKIEFHAQNYQEYADKLGYGDAQDLSWLEPGKQVMRQKEQVMHDAAGKIQLWYRARKPKEPTMLDSVRAGMSAVKIR